MKHKGFGYSIFQLNDGSWMAYRDISPYFCLNERTKEDAAIKGKQALEIYMDNINKNRKLKKVEKKMLT